MFEMKEVGVVSLIQSKENVFLFKKKIDMFLKSECKK